MPKPYGRSAYASRGGAPQYRSGYTPRPQTENDEPKLSIDGTENVLFLAFGKKVSDETDRSLARGFTFPGTPSEQQSGIYDWVRHGAGHCIVVSTAGSGKTTTLKGMLAIIPGAKPRVSTCHSFGFQALKRTMRSCFIDKKKPQNIMDALQVPREYQSFVCKLLDYSRDSLIGVTTPAEDTAAYMAIVRHHGLSDMIPGDSDDAVLDAVRWTMRALTESIRLAKQGTIDFCDMLYMPLYLNVKMDTYKWVLLDEAQDINPARLALARRVVSPDGGRLVAVGDSWQAIFGFTGAMHDSLDQIKAAFNAAELPLTVSYRCSRAVVESARQINPDIHPAPNAPDGRVYSMDQAEFSKLQLGIEDGVLCRNNAPLVDIAMGLIRRGIPCHIEGREIGEQLCKLVTRWKSTRTIDQLRARLEDYRERETAKLMVKGMETAAGAVNDAVDTILAIAGQLPNGATLEDLQARITGLFKDSNGNRRECCVLSSIHKAKGLEWHRVYIYGANKYMPSKYARQEWQLRQERCLDFVARTRAKLELCFVSAER